MRTKGSQIDSNKKSSPVLDKSCDCTLNITVGFLIVSSVVNIPSLLQAELNNWRCRGGPPNRDSVPSLREAVGRVKPRRG